VVGEKRHQLDMAVNWCNPWPAGETPPRFNSSARYWLGTSVTEENSIKPKKQHLKQSTKKLQCDHWRWNN